ncbi:MAG: Hpt domain-containing protein [Candidatus Omnitrophica bacterium]|nr:Hpt domain-containing protein [Candidatus Omnitrophota bacterium]
MEKLDINFLNCANQLGLSLEDYKELLTISLADANQDIMRLETIIENKQEDQYFQVIHHLKGTLCSLMIKSVTDTISTMNDLAQKKQNLNQIPKLYSVLKQRINQLNINLNE